MRWKATYQCKVQKQSKYITIFEAATDVSCWLMCILLQSKCFWVCNEGQISLNDVKKTKQSMLLRYSGVSLEFYFCMNEGWSYWCSLMWLQTYYRSPEVWSTNNHTNTTKTNVANTYLQMHLYTRGTCNICYRTNNISKKDQCKPTRLQIKSIWCMLIIERC